MAHRTEGTGAPTGARAFVPKFFSRDDGSGLPNLEQSKPFIFAHHRKRWTIIDGRLVPDLSKIPLVAGANRVSYASDGSVRFADTQAKLQDRQFKILAPELGPDGTYLQELDTLPSGASNPVVTYITAWETAHVGSSTTEIDEKGYADWLESLVTDGHIAPCTRHRVTELLSAAKGLLGSAEQRLAKGKGGTEGRVELLRAHVAVLERHLEQLAQPQKAIPVKGRRGSLRLDTDGKEGA